MRKSSPIFCLLLAAGLLALGACRKAPDRRQVILLLLDAARADRFSCYGYTRPTTPEIDRLAAAGVVFHRHYAQGTGTRVSVPALLYSRYYSVPIFPNDPQVPYSAPEALFRRPDDEQISFVKAFERAGFTTAAISAHLWTGEDTPFAAEFMQMHDLTRRFSSRQYPYPRAWGVVDSAIEWIDEHRDRDFFLYVHLMDTHYPHFFEEDAQDFFGAASYDAENFAEGGGPQVAHDKLSEDDLRYIDALYDGSLRYADREIGRLFEFLRDEKILETATVALTSDHGERLRDGPDGRPRDGTTAFSHGGAWREPVARVPLIVHSPQRLAPGHFHELSEGIDVGPTLLALAGVDVPPGKAFDGVDLAAVIDGQIAPKEQVLMRQGIRTAKYKCLFSTRDRVLLRRQAPDVASLRGELYDLESDPGETKNLFNTEKDVVADLLERYRQAMQPRFQRAETAVTDEQPRAAFAISSRYFLTEEKLPELTGFTAPVGWSRVKGDPHSVLIARNASRALGVRFRIPNGRYRLHVGLVGRATVAVDGVESEVAATEGSAPFGDVQVTDETFRATIRAPADELVRIFFFGFVPPGASLDPGVDDERRKRLRALGYIQ